MFFALLYSFKKNLMLSAIYWHKVKVNTQNGIATSQAMEKVNKYVEKSEDLDQTRQVATPLFLNDKQNGGFSEFE